MKDFQNVYKLLREKHTVSAKPRLIAEFNHNRYAGAVASNTPLPTEDDEDPDVFDIDSIVEGRRPGAGIIKGRVGQMYVAEDYDVNPTAERYYLSSPDDAYKYWCSPKPTLTTAGYNFPAGTAVYPTDVNPQVTYTKKVKANKIVIGLENTFSSPAVWNVYVMPEVGGTWELAKSSTSGELTPDSEGRVTLYWNGSSWTNSRDITNYTKIAGVQLRVQSMDKPDTFFNLIELGARLEWNMTSYLMSVSDTFDLGDTTSLNPIGTGTSNVAEASLFNHYEDGFIFNDDNTDSLFAGIMEENVKFTLDYLYDTSSVSAIAETPIRQFEMYTTGHWSAQGTETVSLDLRDSSKFLQEIKSPALFYEGLSVTGIIYRILDAVGFDQYDIGNLGQQYINGVLTNITRDANPFTVPYFWSSPEQTVWEVLQDLAEGTQTAIYFDAWDRLQILTCNQIFSNTSGKSWTLRGSKSGKELTDIQEYSMEQADTTNDVTVNYQTTQFEEYVQGSRRNTIIWQPEDETIYVKASDLLVDLLKTDTTLRLAASEAALWPFESMMQIEAETIAYKGKQYIYYPSTSNSVATVMANPVTVWLESYDDYKKYHFDKTPVRNRYLNKFTGRIKIEERGVWNSPITDHKVETLSSWSQKNVRGGNGYTDINGMFKSKRRLASYKQKYSTARKRYLKNKTPANRKRMLAASAAYKAYASMYSKYRNAAVTDGISVPAEKATVLLKTNSTFKGDHYLMAVRGNYATDLGFKYYGTGIRFNSDSSATNQCAGIVFQSQHAVDAAGYRAELVMSPKTGGLGRVQIFRTTSTGGVAWIKFAPMVVLSGKWYNLDVEVIGNDSTSTYKINVYVNGIRMLSESVSGSNKILYTGRFGMYARGRTNASFEYIYAIGQYNSGEWPRNFASYDRMNKGFSSARFSDFASNKIDMKVKRKVRGKYRTVPLKYTRFFFDEFGPICHEIRKFDVKYDTSGMPVQAPFVFFTNTNNVELYEVASDSYSSTVYMMNTSRDDASLQGTDDNHQFCMYGLVLKQRDVQTVKTQNKQSVAAGGLKELTVDSKWIQTKDAAQRLADWISEHWMGATDSMSVTVFGNPLIEVGDVVTMDIEDSDIDEATHKYFVLSANTEFSDGGMETILKLRRARN